MGEPIDPAPFEREASGMPAAVRMLIAEAREGRGPALGWLTAERGGWGQVGDCFGLLRGHPERLSDECVGWLVGIGMFGDDLHALPDVFEREHQRGPALHAIDAFVAGIRAGVPIQKRQWKSVERLVIFAGSVPAALREILPIGLASEQALTRGVALRIGQRIGAALLPTIRSAAREATQPKAKKRLAEALAALQGEDRGEGGKGGESSDDGEGESDGAPPADGRGSGASADGAAAVPGATGSGTLDPGTPLLARLLEAYAATFDPALAPLVRRLGAREGKRRPAIEARSKGELEGAWLAIAAKTDPGDVERLVGTPWPGAWKVGLERVRALGKFAPDPRIVDALGTLRGRYTSFGSQPIHHAGTTARTHHLRPQAGAADPALLAEAEAATREEIDVPALWRAFYEAPGDRERRHVLADGLQTIGDPRGEYIALSLALDEGRAPPNAKRRAAELLQPNIDAWTGNLPGVHRASRRFERGFLVGVRLKCKPAELARAADVLELRTVEELHLDTSRIGHALEEPLAAVLAKATSLRALVYPSFDEGPFFAAVGARGPFPGIRVLASLSWVPSEPCPGFPSLAMVGVSVQYFPVAEALAAAVGAGLTALVCAFAEIDAALLAAFDASTLPELRVARPNRSDWNDIVGWTLRLRRGDAPVELRHAAGRHEAGRLPAILSTLASAGRRSFVVSLPATGRPAAQAEAEAAATTLGVSIAFADAPADVWSPPS